MVLIVAALLIAACVFLALTAIGVSSVAYGLRLRSRIVGLLLASSCAPLALKLFLVAIGVMLA